MKTVIIKMKNSIDQLNNRLHTSNKRISTLGKRTTEESILVAQRNREMENIKDSSKYRENEQKMYNRNMCTHTHIYLVEIFV